jgi:tRNA (cmo5U34)-methyltransferase
MDNTKTNFGESHWADNDYVDGYLSDSDITVPQRKQVLQLLSLIFSFYIKDKYNIPTIIDLGCGDGVVTKALLEVNADLQSVLIDASEHMLETARNNIPAKNIRDTIHITFQDLYKSSLIEDNVDFIASSLAIHHLSNIEKDHLYKYAHSKLRPGGIFINYDVVLSSSPELEELNLVIWKEWILNFESKLNIKRDKSLDYKPAEYKTNKEDHPGTLDSQLEMLKNAGFTDVTVYYKYGLFCLFGGRKL